jgi:hypothetical protein
LTQESISFVGRRRTLPNIVVGVFQRTRSRVVFFPGDLGPFSVGCHGSGSTMLLLLLVLLLWLVSLDLTVAVVVPIAAEALSSSSVFASVLKGPLEDWLDQLKLDIPDQSFKAGGLVKIDVRGLHCTHFSVKSLHSEFNSSGSRNSSNGGSEDGQDNGTAATLHLSVQHVAAACAGSYRVSGAGSAVSGTLRANLTTTSTTNAASSASARRNNGNDDNDRVEEEDDALQWTLQVDRSNGSNSTNVNYPTSVRTTDCVTALAVSELQFSGSASAKILDLFRSQIECAVNHAFATDTICPVLSRNVDPLLTSYVAQAMDWLGPFLSNVTVDATTATMEQWSSADRLPGKSVLLSSSSSRRILDRVSTDARDRRRDDDNNNADEIASVDFARDVPVLISVLDGVNSFVRGHLDRGWFVPTFPDTRQQCNGLLDGVNGVLRNVVTDPVPLQFLKSIPIHVAWPKLAHLDVVVKSVALSGDGLHEWQDLVAFQPLPNTTGFTTVLHTSGPVLLTAHVTLNVSAIPGGRFHGRTLTEEFAIQLDLTSMATSLDVDVDLNKALFERLRVGTLMDVIDNLFSRRTMSSSPEAACILESIQNLVAKRLSAVVRIKALSVVPSRRLSGVTDTELEDDLDLLVDHLIELFLNEYPLLITDAISGFTKGPVMNRLNKFLAKAIDTNNRTCVQPDFSSGGPHWLNFTEGKLLRSFNSFLQRAGTLSTISRYIDCTMDALVNMLQVRMPRFGIFARMQNLLRLRDFRVQNFGSIERLQLLDPTEDGMDLRNSVLVQSTNLSNRPAVLASIDVDAHSVFNATGSLNFTAYFDSIGLGGSSALHYDKQRLQEMTLVEMLSHADCSLVPADDLEFHDFNSSLGFVQGTFNLSLIKNDAQAREYSVDSSNYPDVEKGAVSLLSWVVGTVGRLATAMAKSALTSRETDCENQRAPSDGAAENVTDDEGYLPDSNTVLLILSAIFIFVQPTILLMKRRIQPAEDGLSRDGLHEPLLNPLYQQNETSNRLDRPLSRPSSLMFDGQVPETARYLLPICAWVTIAVLLASNLTIGASVDLTVAVDYHQFRLPSLFGFSLFNTARDMLQARIYPLFFLVVVFSGIWPYMKLLLMLVAWTHPKSMISSDFRGRLLLKLDALSKFSLVDTYVLIGTWLQMVRWLGTPELCSSKPHNPLPLFFSDGSGLPLPLGSCRRYFGRRVRESTIWLLRFLGGHNNVVDSWTPHGILPSPHSALRRSTGYSSRFSF